MVKAPSGYRRGVRGEEPRGRLSKRQLPGRWKVEGSFVPKDLREARELRQFIRDSGYAPSIANGVVGWILEKLVSGVDDVSLGSRTRYRSILAGLEPAWRRRKGRDKSTS
jgi:hypothetical protein